MIYKIASLLCSTYPVRGFLTVLLYAITAAFSGIGIVMIIPLLSFGSEETSGLPEAYEEYFHFINRIGLSADNTLLILGLLALIFLFKAVFNVWAQYNSEYIKLGFETSYRKGLFERVLNSNILKVANVAHGEAINILVNETRMIGMLSEYLMRCISLFLQILVYLLLIFLISPELMLITGMFGAATYFLVKKVAQFAKKSGKQIVSVNSLVQSLGNSTLQGFRTIKAFAAESDLNSKMVGHVKKYSRLNIRLSLIENSLIASFEPLVIVFLVVLYPFFDYDIPVFIAFTLLLAKLYQSFQGLQGQYYKLSRHAPSLSAYDQLIGQLELGTIDNKKLQKNPGGIHSENLIGLHAVEFNYMAGGFNLGPISIEINKNSFVSIIGESGSGKSTLAMIILGLVTPEKGEVSYKDRSIYSIPRQEYLNKIGYVGQDVFMNNDTIKNNIIFGRNVDEEKLQTAIQLSNLTTVIDGLPDKLDTIIGDSGSKLSGGQKQRVSIARALYDRPEVLILDEATSSLDMTTSSHILNELSRLKSEISIVQITHKIHETENSDCIYVIRDGSVIESGNYDYLTKKSLFHLKK